MNSPVEVGQSYTVTIDGYAGQGEGVSRIGGMAIFIPGGIPGELVRCTVQTISKQYGRASLDEVLETSNQRVEASCRQYQDCGGCTLQHMAYQEQLRLKGLHLVESLRRLGGLSDFKVLPPIGMADPWRYRNRIQLHVGSEGQLGFYRPATHTVLNWDGCQLIPREIEQLVSKIIEQINQWGKALEFLRHVVLQWNRKQEVMLVLVTTVLDLPESQELVLRIRTNCPGIVTIMQNINPGNGSLVLGSQWRLLKGQKQLQEQIGPLALDFSPRAFVQVNPEQTEILCQLVVNAAKAEGVNVLDGYCGVGLFSLFLAQTARRVEGVELSRAAVITARANARRNQINNVRFIAGAMEEVLVPKLEYDNTIEVVVLDPPRQGCRPQVLEGIIKLKPQRIVYVSCNPATLARDLKILTAGGFSLQQVQGVDMFPQTPHVETVVLIERK